MTGEVMKGLDVPVPQPLFYEDGEPMHPDDALTRFGFRLGIMRAVDGRLVDADAPEIANALWELTRDFDALHAAIVAWVRMNCPKWKGRRGRPCDGE